MADTVPIDGRALWAGTAVSIPANWSRDTNFDGRFLQGHTSAGANGGAATHTHNSPAHNHTQSLHSHSLTISGASSGSTFASLFLPNTNVAADAHRHASGSASGTATNQATAATITGDDGRPPHTTVLVIAPDDGLQDVPDDGIVFSDGHEAPAGFAVTDGAGGTTDLDGDFIQGAEAAADGGDPGGTATHTHDSPNHNHTQNAHTHPVAVFGASNTTFVNQSVIGPSALAALHHTAIFVSSTAAVNVQNSFTTDAASSEPAYHALLGIQNTSGSASTPDHAIIPYVGAVGAIPSPWVLCDGTEGTPDLSAVQIKITKTPASVGTTGGSNTHIHTAPAHDHAQNAHGHTYTLNTANIITVIGSGAAAVATLAHTHTSDSFNTTTANNQTTAATIDSADGRYKYRTVLFIQKRKVSVHIEGGDILGGVIAA